MIDYDFEKENYKVCPVCRKIIDYHIVGFINYWRENIWICRDHTIKETEQALGRSPSKKEKKWIEHMIGSNPTEAVIT